MMPFLGIDIIPVAITIFWIWMLVDCITNNKLKGGRKICWLLLIFFTHIVGAIIYFFLHSTERNPITAFTYYYQQMSKFFKQNAPQPTPPPPSNAYRESGENREYQQGYQARESQPQAQQAQQAQTGQYQQKDASLYTPPKAEYEEQLTIPYPEMPQQQ
jgi:Phospholipase_D-nuclease N-terminal